MVARQWGCGVLPPAPPEPHTDAPPRAGRLKQASVTRHELPRWVWLWFPLALFFALLGLALRDDSDPTYTRRWWAQALIPYSEYDFIEQATAVAAALAVIAGIAALRHRHRLPSRWVRGWVAVVTAGCFYILGEEVSWGQYAFGWLWGSGSLWDAPEWWPSVHTNIHGIANEFGSPYQPLAAWFTEGPRLLLELFVLGGIIRVLVSKARVGLGTGVPLTPVDWFWPTYVCLPSAVLAILARVPDRMDWLGVGYAPLVFDPGLLNWQSFQEMHFSQFLFLYLLSIWYRVTAQPVHLQTQAVQNN
jgi:hypothetical protein